MKSERRPKCCGCNVAAAAKPAAVAEPESLLGVCSFCARGKRNKSNGKGARTPACARLEWTFTRVRGRPYPMLDIGLSLIAFIVAIGVLVAVHEFGHFWVARRLGFKVLRFSIGFGKPLARWRGRDADATEYWISSLPLGGYVKMLDEREGPVPEAERHRAFNNRPPPHRIAVLLAGPGFNFLFAVAAYWLLFVTGVPGMKPYIGDVEPGSIADRAGLMAADIIEAIDGEPTETWEHATLAILDGLLDDSALQLRVRGSNGSVRDVELDLRGRISELTEPDALFPGLGIDPGPAVPVPAVVGDVIAGS